MSNLPTKCYFLNISGHFYPFFFNTTYRMVAFAAVSFAEGITFGAWLRALAAPVASDGDETITQGGNSWGGSARTARINVTAVAPDGNAGFNMGVYNDMDMALTAGDEANLWVKPLDMIKVSYGKYDNNTLRGDLCYGSWNWARPSAWIAGDEGLLMSGNGAKGLMVEATPMENLYIQAMVPILSTPVKAGGTYKNLRGGFKYTVPSLLNIKGQYIGSGAVAASDEEKAEMETKLAAATTDAEIAKAQLALLKADGSSDSTLEAEVDVLAVEGLFAGVGFQYNIVKDASDISELEEEAAVAALDAATTAKEILSATKDLYNAGYLKNQMKIALGASYQVMPELKVSASGAFFTYYKCGDVKVDPRFQAGAGVDYDLGDGLAVNADFRYVSPIKIDGEKADNTDHIAFSVGVQKSVSSNGYIGVAFQGVTNSGNLGPINGAWNDDFEPKPKNFVWAIPVALSVWF